MNELFEEKMKIVLNLIRTNNTADDVMKITQAALNLAHTRNYYSLSQSPEAEPKTIKKQTAGV